MLEADRKSNFGVWPTKGAVVTGMAAVLGSSEEPMLEDMHPACDVFESGGICVVSGSI